MAIEVRKLEDLEEMRGLIRESDRQRYTKGHDGKGVVYFGCWLESQPAGIAAVGADGEGRGRITRFFVSPGCRGRGVGSTLLKAVVDASSSEYMSLLLSTTCPIESGFYGAHGFHRTDREGASHEISLVGG